MRTGFKVVKNSSRPWLTSIPATTLQKQNGASFTRRHQSFKLKCFLVHLCSSYVVEPLRDYHSITHVTASCVVDGLGVMSEMLE
jgi:hypothetical protein